MAERGEAEHRMLVNQAAGMVAVQADCTIEEAFVLINERATMTDATLEEIIAGVLDRRIRFSARED